MVTHEPADFAITRPPSSDEFVANARVRAVTIRPRRGFELLSGFAPVLRDPDEDIDTTAVWLVPVGGRPDMEVAVLPGGAHLLKDLDRLSVDLSGETIRQFAGRYGWLVGPVAVRRCGPDQATAVPRSPGAPVRVVTGGGDIWAEPLEEWIGAVLRLAALRRMWRAVVTIQAPSAAGVAAQAAQRILKAAVNRSGGVLTYVIAAESNGYSHWEARRLTDEAEGLVLRQIPANDMVTAATFAVCREINLSLAGQVDTTLMPFRSREMRQIPKNLLASAYLQFAVEVSGGTGWRICQWSGCQTRFPGRRNQKYCSLSHKNAAAYQARVDPKPKGETP